MMHLSDRELQLLVFGLRRLRTRQRGDLRAQERRGRTGGPMYVNVQTELRETEALHSRLMREADRRGVHVPERKTEQPA